MLRQQPAQRVDQPRALGGRLAHERRDRFGERGGDRRHGSRRAGREALADHALGADEHVEPGGQVRRHPVKRRIRDLHPNQVGRALAQLPDDLHRHRIAGALGVLVQVERRRCAGGRRASEVLEHLAGCEREVRWPDHRDAVGANLRGVDRESARLSGRLRAAMHDHLESPGTGHRQLGDAPPLTITEQDTLAGGPEHEQAVKTARRVELEQRREPLLVEPLPVVA
jgi:hypothetical protein